MEAFGVVPVHPAQGGQLDVFDGPPRSLVGSVDQLGLVEPADGLGEGVGPRRRLRLIPMVGSELFG